jgi:hypothetical protein
VIEDLAGTDRRPAETMIRNAREKLATEMLRPEAQKRRQ